MASPAAQQLIDDALKHRSRDADPPLEDLPDTTAIAVLQEHGEWRARVYNTNPIDRITQECAARKVRFRDPEFPPTEHSLYKELDARSGLRKLDWGRLSDLLPSPQLFDGGADPDDIEQGMLGDCWLLSALASFATAGDITELFSPSCFNPYGVYTVRFNIDNQPRWVVVDDHVPIIGTTPAFSKSRGGELWAPLLEKAVAKLHGSYQAIVGGCSPAEGERESTATCLLSDLSGGYAHWYKLNDETSEDAFCVVQHALHSGGFATMACGDDNEAEKCELGLVSSHEYSVIRMVTVGKRKFVRLRNPWGKREWKGAWCDGHALWAQHPDVAEALEAGCGADDGAFWMGWEDTVVHFESVSYCFNLCKGFHVRGFKGGWSAETSGSYKAASWGRNSRYQLDLDSDSTVFVELKPPDKRFTSDKAPYMMLLLVRWEESFPKHKNSVVWKSALTDRIGAFVPLSAGRYWLVPCTQRVGEESDFFLRVAAAHDVLQLCDVSPLPHARLTDALHSVTCSAGMDANDLNAKLLDVFSLMDGDGEGTISLHEFHQAYAGLESFGLTSDKGVERVFRDLDKNHDKRLSFDEFAVIMLHRARL
eukprot:Sspe_Gene.96386::Locus_69060_Transcript_1_1_Confidence_1.000_Length_2042::g.96386::m.96386